MIDNKILIRQTNLNKVNNFANNIIKKPHIFRGIIIKLILNCIHIYFFPFNFKDNHDNNNLFSPVNPIMIDEINQFILVFLICYNKAKGCG